jgi:hypothetical protein
VKRTHQLLIGIVAAGLVGTIVGEHAIRRSIERRYQALLGRQRQMEMEYAEVAATHRSLTSHLEREQQRSQELADALAATRAKLEEAMGRLAAETRDNGELKMRLAKVQGQMDQLQGELVAALQDRASGQGAESARPIQLERVVVSSAGALGTQGRVLSVDQEWNFVIIDLGWNAVRIGDTVSIVRDDQVLAQARIERVQETVCAASVLPEWDTGEIRVNDLARLL